MQVWCFVVVGLHAAFLLGCGAISNSTGDSVAEFEASESDSSLQCVIDAGIVFAEQSSYVGVLLSGLGFAESCEVLSGEVDPSISDAATAFRIDCRSSPATAGSKYEPSNLVL